MTKLDLQKELLAKIKLGTKPSDLKKGAKLNKIPVSPPSMEIKDEGYSSEEEKPTKNQAKENNHHRLLSNDKVGEEAQIKALNKQLQLYKDFREADLKIKEKQKKEIEQLNRANTNLTAGMDRLSKLNEQLNKNLKELQQKNSLLNKTITDLQNQAKTPPKETKTQSTQTEPTHFYCDNCQQNKHGSYLLRKLDSPFEPRTHKKLCYLCSTCQKYTKEYNEKENWKEEDNPYKLYD